MIQTKPSGTSKITCILAPDIPVQYGGSYVFINNKSIIKDYDSFELYTSPKYIAYLSGTPVANKIQFNISHDANENIKLEMFVRIYKV